MCPSCKGADVLAMCRSSREGECFSSECKLVCDDLIRLGHSNILMDPGVRLAYNLADARIIYRPESVGHAHNQQNFNKLPSRRSGPYLVLGE